MAIGDEASGLGWPLVRSSDLIREGAQEINRTRDMAAEAYNKVPNSQTNFQKAAGIRVGTEHPDGLGEPNGNNVIYFRYMAADNRILIYMKVDGVWRVHRGS